MNIRKQFPYEVEEIENIWIKMSDGTRLAARMWKPQDADKNLSTIIEYIPYRKRDMKRLRDESIHHYFAGYGFVSLRIDIRGSGDSEGILTDEYLEQELIDGEEIIEWIGNQPWSNGNVGIIGISWGGFNGLQLAARRPKGLKAIITVCSTDDRYADDVHYMGGCLLGDNLSWASVMFGKNSLPPDPEIVGNKWKDMWLERLDKSGLWLEQWLRHQQRDDYWKHGSICENYDDIEIPVMAVSGWADGYTNAVFRLMKNLSSPRLGLIGPWSHKYPHLGEPGPAIDFLQEAVRWWEKWLNGNESGIMNEPMLRLWMQKSVPPNTCYESRPGYWVGLDNWPAKQVKEKKFILSGDYMVEEKTNLTAEKLTIRSPLRLGLFAGKWCSYNAPPDLPGDQREEDGGAQVFTSTPLKNDMEIVGPPMIDFLIETDKPVAILAVRLSDVMPDGKATRVTYGVKNLTHFESNEHPTLLEPAKKYRVKLQLNDIAHVFPKDHRMRISVSTSYWPIVWTPPEVATLTLYTEKSFVYLPERISKQNSSVSFQESEGAEPSTEHKTLHAANYKWDVIRDLINDKSTLHVLKDNGTYRIENIDLEISDCSTEDYSVQNDFVDSVKGETHGEITLKRKNWKIRTVNHTALTSDKKKFHVHATLDAYENGLRVFSKNWQLSIPREFV